MQEEAFFISSSGYEIGWSGGSTNILLKFFRNLPRKSLHVKRSVQYNKKLEYVAQSNAVHWTISYHVVVGQCK